MVGTNSILTHKKKLVILIYCFKVGFSLFLSLLSNFTFPSKKSEGINFIDSFLYTILLFLNKNNRITV